jgi:hypothetical protein
MQTAALDRSVVYQLPDGRRFRADAAHRRNAHAAPPAMFVQRFEDACRAEGVDLPAGTAADFSPSA